jgi:heme oxygenase (biliverdin-producing, ferredoxin)
VPLSLAEALKAETRSLHTTLERGPLMQSLLRGQMPRAAYCALLRNLHAVYAVLEPALEHHASHPGLAPVYSAELFRCAALAEDLAELHGAAWQVEIASVPTALRYAQHLNQLASHRPDLLAAHAYVRYLGDLSGGQMLRRVVAQALSLAPGRGTQFYDFGEPADVVRQVRTYRAGLDQLAHDDAQVRAVVAEAILAFELHQALFDELSVVTSPPRPQAAASVSPAN